MSNHDNHAEPLSAGSTVPRASVISLSYANLDSLYASYIPFFTNGGLFLPMQRDLAFGTPLLITLELMGNAEKFRVRSTVAWITPKNAEHQRPQGVGVHFDAGSQAVRTHIETLLIGFSGTHQITHTL